VALLFGGSTAKVRGVTRNVAGVKYSRSPHSIGDSYFRNFVRFV